MTLLIVVIFSMCLLSVANFMPTTNDDVPIELVVPKDCIGKNFCSSAPENYEEIQKRISQLVNNNLIFSVQDTDGMNIDVRLGALYSDKTDWHNCPIMEEEEEPILAQDPVDTNRYNVVIQRPTFRQRFTKVTCSHAVIADISNNSTNRQCFPDLLSQNSGLSSTCEERLSMRLLYIFDHDKNLIKMKDYRIPVYCSCKLSPSL